MLKKLLQSASIVLLVGALFSCENSMKTVQNLTSQDTIAAVSASDIRYERTDSGRLQLVLTSPLMLQYDGDAPYTEFPKGFKVEFYDTTGRPISILKANYGIRKEKLKILQARNNVMVENLNTHKTLYTENLIWNEWTKKITAPSFVKIVGPNETILGDSMVSNESFTHQTIYGIRGVLNIKEDSLQ
ncbi:MAG: LPS export ABC transporter periplasmic protein LptC [Bacteroidales bacterium]|nr:LPS export ABC transporter periplasmic protein LptC [Bacteroidales bacterium]